MDAKDYAVEAAARDYAWKWFQYHASQRQTVFQFFLAVIGAVLAAYLAVLHSGANAGFARFFGLLIMVLGFLFWRLDCRGGRLVKIAEQYLKVDEANLASLLGRSEIKLIEGAGQDKGAYPCLECVHSFRQIYMYIFILIGLMGFVIVLLP